MNLFIKLAAEENWEVHYSPMVGDLCLKKGAETKYPQEWSERHEFMRAFIDHRASGDLIPQTTTNYGHEMFHGHSGRVDIYVWANKNNP